MVICQGQKLQASISYHSSTDLRNKILKKKKKEKKEQIKSHQKNEPPCKCTAKSDRIS